MKRKTRFSTGGVNNPFHGDDVDPFSAVRDDEGRITRSEGPSSEKFYDETSGRELSSRRNLETGEYYSTEPTTAPKQAPRQAQKASSAKDKKGDEGVRFGEQGPRRPGYQLEDVRKQYQDEPGQRYYYGDNKLLYLRGPELMKSYQPRRPEYTADVGGGRGRSAGRTASDVDTEYERVGEIPGTVSRSLTNTKTTAEKVRDEVGDNTMKALAATGVAGVGAAGLAKLKKMADARKLLNKEAAQRFSAPQARQIASQAQQVKEKTTSQPSQASKGRAEPMEKAKSILSRPETKSARASRTRRSEEDSGIEFSRGGSTASRRADGCAQRGKTRGKMY